MVVNMSQDSGVWFADAICLAASLPRATQFQPLAYVNGTTMVLRSLLIIQGDGAMEVAFARIFLPGQDISMQSL